MIDLTHCTGCQTSLTCEGVLVTYQDPRKEASATVKALCSSCFTDRKMLGSFLKEIPHIVVLTRYPKQLKMPW